MILSVSLHNETSRDDQATTVSVVFGPVGPPVTEEQLDSAIRKATALLRTESEKRGWVI